MRVIAMPEHGAPATVHETEIPDPRAGEVRVRVHAASVNGFDLAVLAGYLQGAMEHRFPVVVGKDFAGVVDALGEGVTDYAVGDRVFGVVTKEYLGDGSFGDYVTVPVAVGIAPLPEGISFADGGALGLAGTAALTSLDAATEAAGGLEGKTVLVVGAPGGVGSYAVQLARHAGARVVATASTDVETAHVTALGAAAVVDHTADLAAQVSDVAGSPADVVLHLAGDPVAALGALVDKGTLVSTLLQTPDQVPAEGVTVVPVYANPTRETLERLAAEHAAGRVRTVVQATYPLASGPEALAAFAAGTVGKILVEVA